MTGLAEPTVVSYAYPRVGLADRAELARRLGSHREALGRLGELDLTGFVLSTCLRIELAIAHPADRLEAALGLVFGGTPAVEGGVVTTGRDAVEHLFRVAAGLESPVVGEREILTQFRHAVVATRRYAVSPRRFGGTLDAAIAAARASRAVLPEDPRRSLAATAARLLEGEPRVGVVGFGTIGRSVVSELLALPDPPAVEVFVRRPEMVDLAEVTVHGAADAAAALLRLPAMVTATSAKTRIIDGPTLERILARRSEPITLVDMAVPPDLGPAAAGMARYHDIDDLAELARDRTHADDANRLVAEAARRHVERRLAARRSGPVIEGLYAEADRTVDEVVRRFAGRLRDPEDQPLLEQSVRTAVHKLLHRPVAKLGGDGAVLAETVADLFGLSS